MDKPVIQNIRPPTLSKSRKWRGTGSGVGHLAPLTLTAVNAATKKYKIAKIFFAIFQNILNKTSKRLQLQLSLDPVLFIIAPNPKWHTLNR